MNDSDAFFMLELQQRDQEKEMLRLGQQPADEIAKSLQSWTTAEHRRAARHDIIFHAGEVPSGIDAARTKAENFISEIQKRLGSPIPYADHRYWIRGVEAWKRLRKFKKQSISPPELALPYGGLQKQFTWANIRRHFLKLSWFLAYKGHQLILGQSDRLTLISPHWADHLLLRKNLESFLDADDGPLLVIRNNPGAIDLLVGDRPHVRLATLREVLDEEEYSLSSAQGGTYTNIFVHLPQKDCRHVPALIKRCRFLMRENGACCFFIHNRSGETNEGLSPELLALVEGAGTGLLAIDRCTFVGGALKQFNRDLYSRMGKSYVRHGAISLLWISPMLAISIPFVVVCNLYQYSTRTNTRKVYFCSSMAIHFSAATNKAA